MKQVPAVILGNATLRYRADGRWGYVDPFQSPQHYNEDIPWACLIPRKDTIPDLQLATKQWVLWRNINHADVDWQRPRTPTATIHLGRVKLTLLNTAQECAIYLTELVVKYVEKRGRPSSIADLLIHAMKRNILKLQQLPMLLRDIITVFADFQRCFLELYAWHTFHTDVRVRASNLQVKGQCWDVNVTWMGVFTTSASLTATLWEAGVPVWQIRERQFIPRDIKIARLGTITWDPDIITQLDSEPQDVLHTGLDGQARNRYMRPLGRVPLHHYSTALPLQNDLPETLVSSHVPSSSTSVTMTTNVGIPPPPCPPSPPLFSCHRKGPFVVENISEDVLKRISQRVVSDVGRSLTPSLQSRSGRMDARNRLGRTKQANHFANWDDPETSLLPKTASIWELGIKKVVRDVAEGTASWKSIGYAYPDPFLFARVSAGERLARYLANWLMIRLIWHRAIEADELPLPQAKVWKEILNGLPQRITDSNPKAPAYASYRHISWLIPPVFEDVEVIAQSSSAKQVASAKKSQGQRDSALVFLGEKGPLFRSMQREVPETLHFHLETIAVESIIGVGSDLTSAIIWEVNELNFRYEVFILDRHYAPHLHVDPATREDRDAMIARVFDTISAMDLIDNPLPETPTGVVATEWKRRRSCFGALRHVVLPWPGCPSTLKHVLPKIEMDYLAAEETLVEFYLQSAYKFLCRRPTLPRVFVP